MLNVHYPTNNNNSNYINDINNTTHHHTNINTSNTDYVKTPNALNIDNGITSVASNIIAVDGNTNDDHHYPLYHNVDIGCFCAGCFCLGTPD